MKGRRAFLPQPVLLHGRQRRKVSAPDLVRPEPVHLRPSQDGQLYLCKVHGSGRQCLFSHHRVLRTRSPTYHLKWLGAGQGEGHLTLSHSSVWQMKDWGRSPTHISGTSVPINGVSSTVRPRLDAGPTLLNTAASEGQDQPLWPAVGGKWRSFLIPLCARPWGQLSHLGPAASQQAELYRDALGGCRSCSPECCRC